MHGIMKYLLRVWGADEEKCKALHRPGAVEPDGPLCYWTETVEEREALCAEFRGLPVVLDRLDPGPDWDGEEIDTEKLTVARITLKLPDGRLAAGSDCFGYGYPAHAAEFQWRENNYSCDCNRSLWIKHTLGWDFPELPCGNTIELVGFEVVKEASDDAH
jgi:hypothetical protein